MRDRLRNSSISRLRHRGESGGKGEGATAGDAGGWREPGRGGEDGFKRCVEDRGEGVCAIHEAVAACDGATSRAADAMVGAPEKVFAVSEGERGCTRQDESLAEVCLLPSWGRPTVCVNQYGK